MDWFRAKLLKERPRSLPWLREIDPGDYQRWFDVIGAMPFALSIETHYGLVGVVRSSGWRAGRMSPSTSRFWGTSRRRRKNGSVLGLWKDCEPWSTVIGP